MRMTFLPALAALALFAAPAWAQQSGSQTGNNHAIAAPNASVRSPASPVIVRSVKVTRPWASVGAAVAPPSVPLPEAIDAVTAVPA